MAPSFFDQPILNSPYEAPSRHHALDDDGQPLDLPPVDGRRRSKLITPVPKPKKTRPAKLAGMPAAPGRRDTPPDRAESGSGGFVPGVSDPAAGEDRAIARG